MICILLMDTVFHLLDHMMSMDAHIRAIGAASIGSEIAMIFLNIFP